MMKQLGLSPLTAICFLLEMGHGIVFVFVTDTSLELCIVVDFNFGEG